MDVVRSIMSIRLWPSSGKAFKSTSYKTRLFKERLHSLLLTRHIRERYSLPTAPGAFAQGPDGVCSIDTQTSGLFQRQGFPSSAQLRTCGPDDVRQVVLESEGNLVRKTCDLRETPCNEPYNAWELPFLGKSEDGHQMLSFGEFPAVK